MSGFSEGLKFQIAAEDKSKRAFRSANDNLKKTARNAKNTQKSLKSIGSSFSKSMLTAAASAAAAAISFSLVTQKIRESVEVTDEIGKMSLRLGIATETLSELKFVAEQSGVPFKRLAKAGQDMSKNISQASQGIGLAVDVLKELGLSAEKLNFMNVADQMTAVHKALKKINNESDKIRILDKLVGGGGVAIKQIFEGTADSVKDLRIQLRMLGGAVTDDAAKAAADLADAWNRSKVASQGFWRHIMTEMSPALQNLTNGITAISVLMTKAKTFEQALLKIEIKKQLTKSEYEKYEKKPFRLFRKSNFERYQKKMAGYDEQIALAKKNLPSLGDAEKKKTGSAPGKVPISKSLISAGQSIAKRHLSANEQLKNSMKALAAARDSGAISQKKYVQLLSLERQRIHKNSAAYKKSAAAFSKSQKIKEDMMRQGVALRQENFSTNEKIAFEEKKLSKLMGANAITEKEYQKFLAIKTKKIIEGSEAYKKQQGFIKEAASLREKHFTTEQKILETRKKFASLLKSGAIDQKEFIKYFGIEKKLIEESSEAYQKRQTVLDNGRDLIQQTLAPMESYAVHLSKITELLEAGAIDQTTFNRSIKTAQDQLKKDSLETADVMHKIFDGLGKDIENSLVEAISGAGDSMKSFKDFSNNLLKDVAKNITRTALRGLNLTGEGGFLTKMFNPFQFSKQGAITSGPPGGPGGLFGGGGFGGGGGLFKTIGSLFGGRGGGGKTWNMGGGFGGGGGGGGIFSAIGNLFGGRFAEGGVLSPKKIGIVGERGPELITAGQAPVRITPMPPGGQASNITINMNIQTQNADSFQRSQGQILAKMSAALNRSSRRNS